LTSGFILTRQWIESDHGLELIFWLASERGPFRFRLTGQEAICFFPRRQQQQVRDLLSGQANQGNWRIGATQLKNFEHEDMSALYFKSQRQLFDCRERLGNSGIAIVESDLKPTDRFLMERFITGGVRISGASSAVDGFRDVEGGRLAAIDYRPQLRTVSIDIETDYTASELYSIAVYSSDESSVLMLRPETSGPTDSEPQAELDLIFYASEADLLRAFLQKIRQLDPDVIIGWNVVNFDLRCLQNFCERRNIVFSLGRNSEAVIWRKAREGNDRYYALVPGRVILDGIELMRTATYQFENFSLEHVSRQLLHRGKLVEDVDQRGAEITQLFNEDKPALARYNLEDCRLVWDIFDKENLLAFAIERALLTGLELDRYGGSVAAFDFLYLPQLHRKGFVAPSLDRLDAVNTSPGGYVMDSVPGIHEHVIVLDFKSLYPSIIRTFHVDPLALVVGLREANPIRGYDGGCFSRSDYILPDLIEKLWAARDQAKAKNNSALSQAIKIIMNSFYGVLGTLGCRFFDSRLVSSITRRGHEIIIESKKFIEARGYKVIYGDTDSVFVLLGAIAADDVAVIGSTLAAQLNRWWRDKLQKEYDIDSYLEIQLETHFSKFLMPTARGSDVGTKKRYAGLIRGSGDENDFHMMFKGLESVRSDWSPLARQFQKILYERIFLDKPFEDYVKQTVNALLDGKFEAELVLRKRLRRKMSDYVKNVPPHVQAARKAESIRRQRNLPSMYESGGWIEYVMTVNGPEPRHFRESAIDYDFYIEKQLGPIADAILVFKASSLHEIMSTQIGLFGGASD
jgi:DNA polymerase-2